MRYFIFASVFILASLIFPHTALAYRCSSTLGEGSGIPEFEPQQKNYDKMLDEFFKSKRHDSSIPFDKIQRKDFINLFRAQLEDSKAELAKIERRTQGNFEQTILPLEHLDQMLSRITEVIALIKSADADPAIEAAEMEALAAASNFGNQIIQSKNLFEIVKRLKDDLALKGEEKKIVDRLYKRFVRNGALLDDAHKKRVAQIDEKLSQLGTTFESNVTKASAETLVWITDRSQLEGLDEEAIKAAAQLGIDRQRPGQFAFAMKGSTYQRIMKTAKNRAFREMTFRAWVSRAKSAPYDNTNIVREMVALRAEKASLLGFNSYAEYVLSDRMAKTVDRAVGFLEELARSALPMAREQMKELRELHKSVAGIDDLKPWDALYLEEMLSERKFGFSEESLRPYFEETRVLQSAFEVAKKLFGVEFKLRNDVPTYNHEVQVYEVSKKGKSIGLLYVDLFERDSKKQGAWMGNFRASGLNPDGHYENAHATIVGGFKKGTNGEPTLLSLDEVTTVFHELGHALHSLLSVAKYKSNTMANATWDFIELPSQFMEDWVYEREVFFNLAKHYKTGASPDENTYQKLLEKRTFMGAANMLGQLRYGLLDLYMYKNKNVDLSNLEEFENQVIGKYRVTEYIPGSYILPTMQHIVSGGYSAGYYSYMWADRMVADAFNYFKDNGGFNPEIALRYEQTIMSQGDLVDADQLFRMFRGRDPDSQALLDKYGIK